MSLTENKNYPALFVIFLPLQVFYKLLCWKVYKNRVKEHSHDHTKV